MHLKVLQFFALFRLDLQSDLTAAVQELTDLLEVLKYLKSANPLQIQHKADKCAQDSHDSPIFAIFRNICSFIIDSTRKMFSTDSILLFQSGSSPPECTLGWSWLVPRLAHHRDSGPRHQLAGRATCNRNIYRTFICWDWNAKSSLNMDKAALQ